jgi:hypothetical protein
MRIPSPPSQVRIQTLATALNVSTSNLRLMIRDGRVPAADHYAHGQYSYWNIETIRGWRPDVARAVDVIQGILQLQIAA